MSFNSILDIIQWYEPLANRDLLADSKARFEDAKRRKLESIAARQQLNQIKEDRTMSMYDRFKPGGDKWESIKADEQWEKVEVDRIQAEEERLRIMGVVDISEQEN